MKYSHIEISREKISAKTIRYEGNYTKLSPRYTRWDRHQTHQYLGASSIGIMIVLMSSKHGRTVEKYSGGKHETPTNELRSPES